VVVEQQEEKTQKEREEDEGVGVGEWFAARVRYREINVSFLICLWVGPLSPI
jgi:hypothetical protein